MVYRFGDFHENNFPKSIKSALNSTNLSTTLQMFIGGVLASYWSFSKIIGHVLQWTMHWSDQFSSFDEEFAVPI